MCTGKTGRSSLAVTVLRWGTPPSQQPQGGGGTPHPRSFFRPVTASPDGNHWNLRILMYAWQGGYPPTAQGAPLPLPTPPSVAGVPTPSV